MKHHAKAPSAGSTQATGNSRGPLRRAFATRAPSDDSKGTGAPAAKLLALAAVSLLALFATTASASAASPEIPEAPTVSEVSYASAQVTGEFTTDGSGGFQLTAYQFQISTDNASWSVAKEDTTLGAGKKEVEAKIDGLKGGTKYFVRLVASNGFEVSDPPEAVSPEPNPSFTTLAADPPAVEQTDNATDVEYTTALVSGKVNRPTKSNDLTCNFEYITDTAYQGNPVGDRFAGATPVACEPSPVATVGSSTVTAKLTGLANATTYHVRLFVSNASLTTDAKEAPSTFTTQAVTPPTVVSVDDASDVFSRQANASGVIERSANPDLAFDITDCRFEYVTDDQFGANGFADAGSAPCVEPIDNTPDAETSVTATLTGLDAETTYHLRLAARNAAANLGTREAANTFTTAAKVATPTVLSIDSPTGVDQDSAKVSGEVERPAGVDPAFDVSCRFQYVTDEQFKATGFEGAGETLCEPQGNPAENPIQTAGPVKVDARLLGLEPSTTYHLRLTAENGGGLDNKDAAATFTTTANFPASAIVLPVTEVSYGGAKLNGEGDSDGKSAAAVYQVSTDEETWTSVNYAGAGELLYATSQKLEPIPSKVVTGLKGGTKYFVRVRIADISCGGDCGVNVALSQPPYPSFTTLPVNSVTVLKADDATDVTAETAKVSGEIERPANPDPAFDANCRFEYVTEAQFQANGFQDAGQTPCGIDSLATPEEKKAVDAELTDLKSGTKYHLRLTGTNAGPDASLEATNTFTTVAVAATVTATAGGSDNEGGYFLSGLVNPRNSTITDCKFVYGPTSETDFKKYPFAVPCSPTPDPVAKPVSVEGHVTGLTPGNEYHFRLVATNAFGPAVTPDRPFTPTLATKEPCPANEQLRIENSSLALPECRAYEMVTPPGKEGFDATFARSNSRGTYDGGNRVAYISDAGNIAKSGQSSGTGNKYVAERTAAGWKPIPDLNGSSGSLFDAPSNVDSNTNNLLAYSRDLLSSVWWLHRQGEPGSVNESLAQLRSPDGTFALIGNFGAGIFPTPVAASADLSHLLVWGWNGLQNKWGPGVYEFLGTGMDQPRRVDLDNSGTPISTCLGTGPAAGANAVNLSLSSDASRIVNYVIGGCGGANPPADEIWARVNGTTAVDVSASHCSRLDCNAPANPTFQGAASDGSRVFFTTTQQLVDEDTDQANDIYACDIPAGTPAPMIAKANPCSAFRQISVAEVGAAEVESVFAQPPVGTGTIASGLYPGVSDDGSTVLFTAKGVLADNKDALGEKALAGDHNLYLWRATDENPDGQTAFLARLEKNDLGSPQVTPDGRYLLFTTANQLLETDTDTARDVYRYDVGAEDLTRVSTNVFGVAGNGDFDAQISGPVEHNPTTAISDDGQKIVFTTTEPLKLAVDNNDEPDVYLWTPDRVSLISTGAVGQGGAGSYITASGQDIYFGTAGAFTPADGDSNLDIYDARIGGGFSFAPEPVCSGEKCQPDPTPISASPPSPANTPNGDGNVKPPKPCPKGKVRKKNGKCVKKHTKGQKHKKQGKKHKRASSNHGGGK